MSLHPVTLNGNYFSANGKRFMPIGAHWVPAKTGLEWPYRWDPADIEADFAKMKDLGFNTVRLDLFWAWFEPRPGSYHPAAFRQFDFFIELGRRYQIYLHPTLFIGGEVGEAYWDVPWRQGRHPHHDAALLRLQTDHAAEFARRCRGEAAIIAWDLTDEPPFWIVADQTTDDMAVNWTRLIAGALRRYDPEHLLCVGTAVEDLAGGPFRPDNIVAEVDFLSAHPYPIYDPKLFPDPLLSERATYCGAFQTALSAGAGRPVMIHELGASSAQYAPEKIAHYDRVSMYSALAAGANGFMPWCYTDAAPELFKQVPYRRAPHETQFGLTTWDRQDRPAGEELRTFSQILAQLDLEGIEPAPAEAALLVPYEWAKPHGDFARLGLSGPGVVPYVSVQDGRRDDGGENNLWLIGSLLSAFIMARRAGLKAALPREYANWQMYPLLLLPSPLTSTEHNRVHVHTVFWDTARTYVRQGGILYASVCADAAIPEMADLFGATLSDHTHADAVTLTLVAPLGDLPQGETFRYRADGGNPRHWPATLDIAGGEVIAVDQNGRPALVANTYGQGRTLLCAYPLEQYLAVQPSAFEGIEPTHKLYGALRQWAGITPLFQTDQPSVEVAALAGPGRGYAVLVNHRPEPQTVSVSARDPLTSVALVAASGSQPFEHQKNSWQMEIKGYGGAVVAWESEGG
ncbi:MAG: beta-galactosidase [Chloroflexota bacterium]